MIGEGNRLVEGGLRYVTLCTEAFFFVCARAFLLHSMTSKTSNLFDLSLCRKGVTVTGAMLVCPLSFLSCTHSISHIHVNTHK